MLAGILLAFFGVSRLFFQTAGSTPMTVGSVILADTDTTISGAVALTKEPDRESFIASMRSAIAERGSSLLALGNPAEDEVILEQDRAVFTDGSPETNGGSEGVVEIQWCDATVLESQFLASWPSSHVSVEVREGARAVVVAPAVPATASSAPPATQSLMQFALNPSQRTEPACLTHAYIGVTQEGRLIHNNDVILYQSYGPTELVGYAFDGNPIYGPTTAETDECGGVAAGGYGYHVSTERDFILGCFMSEPQQSLLVG